MFYDKFVKLCQNKGVSPSKAAMDAGLSKSTVTRWKKDPGITPSGPVLGALAKYFDVSISDLVDYEINVTSLGALPRLTEMVTAYHPSHRIPILGRISAGLPLYAEEHIEGYTYTELNSGGEYFGLRVQGDSMTAARIQEGDLLIVRRQEIVDNGQVAVVMVGDDEATVKRFYQENGVVTLMPQSINPIHRPQIYDIKKTTVRIIGLVVKVEFSI